MLFTSRTHWKTEPNQLSRQIALLDQDKIPYLNLSVSNPTQCHFQYLNEKFIAALQDPQNSLYDPNPLGSRKAREAVVGYYEARGLKVLPEQIILTASTSEAYSFAFRLLMEPGELLLAPHPSYPLIDYLAALHDIKIARYALNRDQKWAVDLTGFYTVQMQEPKVLLMVNPNNPTGNYVHKSELAEINLFTKKRDIAILSDEVFWDYAINPLPDRASTAINRHNLSFTFSGISKTLGLPQMKLSWMVVSGPEPVAKEALRRLEVIADTYLSVSTPAQNALPFWLSQQSVIQKEILTRIQNNYAFLKKQVSNSSLIRSYSVEGGWHAPIQLPTQQSDEEWACLILKKAHVLTHPGYLFDFENASFLVLSLLVPERIFQEGLQKIQEVVKSAG